MRTYGPIWLLLLVATMLVQFSFGQEDYLEEIAKLKAERELIRDQEKEALKDEVEAINRRLERGEIETEAAAGLKEEAARKRARNIQDREEIINTRIALLERNQGQVLEIDPESGTADSEVEEEKVDKEIFISKRKKHKYDRRTYSNLLVAFGLNNAVIEDLSLNETPYNTGRSRFFEIGWVWRTRVFNNAGGVRFHYGFAFQFNGLRSDNSLYFVVNEDGLVDQEVFPVPLNKSKLRLDNLVFPIHLEFGPSRKSESEYKIRYSVRGQFKVGVGAYGGFNIGHRQKLKYVNNGVNVKDKLIGGLGTNTFVYGLSGYIGVGIISFYVKYDLQTIFKDAVVDQRKISAGLRFRI